MSYNNRSSYTGNSSYSNNNSGYSSGSGYSGNSGSGSSNYIPGSRRPDGSYREEIRVKPGHVPEAERQSYIPPAARTSYASNYSYGSNGSQESLEDRVDSWADEDAPVTEAFMRTAEVTETVETTVNSQETLVKITETVSEVSTETVVETVVETVAETTEESAATSATETVEGEDVSTAREPRKPSQLATAIDTALDSLSIGSPSNSNDTAATRQIGRFAAQIANDEREGRTYRRYDGYSNYNNSGYSNNNGYYNNNSSGYYNRDRDGQSGYTRNFNNWNRSGSSNYNSQKETITEETNGTASTTSETRVEGEFKTFLEQLNAYRREMAVINAKLEYIKYVKSRDARELTEVERERLAAESVLVSRLDSIFESIDSLANK